MKIINPRIHGILDYVVVVLFLLAPTLIGFSGIPMILAYALAGIHLALTLVTDFPLGVVKLIPFTIHGWIEYAVGPVLVLVPFIFGFDADVPARYFYIVVGITIIAVALLTDYKGTETTKVHA